MGNWETHVLGTTGQDLKSWRKIVDRVPENTMDVYYRPEYAALYEPASREPAFLFYHGNQDDYAFEVLTRRDVSGLPFADVFAPGDRERLADVATPYGYGGPVVVSSKKSSSIWQSYREAFSDFCTEEGIVARFVRLHPLLENQALYDREEGLYRKSSVVFIDLRQTEEEILEGFRRDHRKSVRRARRKGVIVERTDSESDRSIFVDLYTTTMERLGAREQYRFDTEFFARAFETLGSRMSLFLATFESRPVSAHLVLHTGRFIHNFLSGSDPELWHLKGDVLMTYEIACWARQHSYERFNLGGGHGFNEDSLFFYKSGFSSSRASYFMYREVCQPEAYDRLCRVHEKHVTKGKDEAYYLDFFPRYRAL